MMIIASLLPSQVMKIKDLLARRVSRVVTSHVTYSEGCLRHFFFLIYCLALASMGVALKPLLCLVSDLIPAVALMITDRRSSQLHNFLSLFYEFQISLLPTLMPRVTLERDFRIFVLMN